MPAVISPHGKNITSYQQRLMWRLSTAIGLGTRFSLVGLTKVKACKSFMFTSSVFRWLLYWAQKYLQVACSELRCTLLYLYCQFWTNYHSLPNLHPVLVLTHKPSNSLATYIVLILGLSAYGQKSIE